MPSSDDGVRLTRALRELQRVAPVAVDDAMERVARTAVLPVARTGLRGSLKGSTVVKATTQGPQFVNTKVYANVQHWGGHTWHAQSRVGRSASNAYRAHNGPGIKGSFGVWDALSSSRDENVLRPYVASAIAREIDALLTKHLS